MPPTESRQLNLQPRTRPLALGHVFNLLEIDAQKREGYFNYATYYFCRFDMFSTCFRALLCNANAITQIRNRSRTAQATAKLFTDARGRIGYGHSRMAKLGKRENHHRRS